MKVTRSNPGAFQTLAANLKALEGKVAKAGWFASAVYENNIPVAAIAAQNEFGATLNHPGGTPYRIGPDGRAVFVAKSAPGAGDLPVTKAHQIVIPPRPFMRPTVQGHQAEWMKLLASGAKAVLRGNETPESVMEKVGALAAAQVAQTITQITAPPLAKSTISARRRAMADQKTVGSLDKPLVRTGIMLNTVTNIVENAGNDSTGE